MRGQAGFFDIEERLKELSRQRRTIDRDQATGRLSTDGLVLLGLFEATRTSTGSTPGRDGEGGA
jgi:hypothetical protein